MSRDDHQATLRAVESFLEGNYNVVGAVGDGQSSIVAVEKLSPEVAVIDFSMPRMGDPEYLDAAVAAGAVGYVLKYRSSDLLLAIEAALAGLHFVSPPLADLEV